MVTLADPALKQRIDSERNQGRAPDMGWLDHDRLGFNYRLSDIACALGIAQLGAWTRCSPRARAWPASTARRWRGSRSSAALPGRGGDRRGWFVFVVQLRAAWTATRRCARWRRAGIQSKPYLPAIHLMSFYRERFGHREGEFPVCEDVAARSLALPFFPEMTEGQVARVAEELRSVLGGRRRRLSGRVALPRAPGPDFQRLNTRSGSTGGCGRRTSSSRARTPGCSPRGASSRPRTATRCSRGSTRWRASSRRALPRSRPTTKTSTWRSSGA